MGDVPTINTSTWRLPKKAHSTPEATFTDEMYRAKGLPVDPDRLPTTGGSGLPTVNTNEWVTPSTRRRLEEAKPRRPNTTFEVELDDEEFDDLGDEYNPADFVGLDAEDEGDMGEGCDGSFKRRRLGMPVKGQKGKGRGMGIGQGEGPIGRRAMEGKKSYLKRTVRPDVGPPRAADDDAVGESLIALQRRLAGLTESRHLEFATGTPYRRLPVAERIATFDDLRRVATEQAAHMLGKGEAKTSMKIGSHPWVVVKTSPSRVTVASGSGVDSGSKFRGKQYTFVWDGTGYKRQGQYLHTDGIYAPKSESVLPDEQAALAGLTERAPLPHPMHDTRPLQTPRAHGILDDGADSGESYIEKVLQESRWFFRDFGDLALGGRPFDEAPGGRREPWQGSDDKPAPTPIVRKGKVHGAVGQDKTPEERGEVDVGKSEIDYDYDPGEDEDEPESPPKAKSKPKAPPEDEEEPEDDEDEEEETEGLEFGEADGTRTGRGLRAVGQGLKAAGSRMRHGSAAQKAKEGLSKHLYKFAKKHGLKAFGHTPDDAKRGGKKPGVPKAPPKAPKKGMKPKPKPFAPQGPLHKAGGLTGPKMKK
jgi:hypothetical protein